MFLSIHELYLKQILTKSPFHEKPETVSLFPAHVAWLCKYPDLNKYDLTSVKTVSVVGSTVNPLYERQIFDKLPNMLFFNNVKEI